jgi:hypothetical protein
MLKHKIRSAVTAIAFAGAAVVALPGGAQAAGSAPSAVDWGGVFVKDGHAFSIRSGTNTGTTKLGTVTTGGIPCTSDRCERQTGGSYSCWPGGPSGDEWFHVKWNGTTGWVAVSCVEVGRYS